MWLKVLSFLIVKWLNNHFCVRIEFVSGNGTALVGSVDSFEFVNDCLVVYVIN